MYEPALEFTVNKSCHNGYNTVCVFPVPGGEVLEEIKRMCILYDY